MVIVCKDNIGLLFEKDEIIDKKKKTATSERVTRRLDFNAADLLASSSYVCTGRSLSRWTCTCTADPLSRSALHTGTHLKNTNRHAPVQHCRSLYCNFNCAQKCKWKKKWEHVWPNYFKVLEYILWVGLFLSTKDYTVPVHHTNANTHIHRLKISVLTFKQAPQTFFGLGGR